MPESRECTASGMQAQMTFESAKAAGASFVLEKMALDATKAEAKRSNAPREAKEGLVYDLDAKCTIKRGQNRNQTDVFPPTLRITASNPNPPSLNTLVLEKITYTHRALILHFGNLFFMLQYLTHTHVQFYSRDHWEKSGSFRIGVAFIFASHVLAFPSIDLVFQPTWANAITEFDIPPNIYTSTTDFLSLVADWIEEILQEPNYGRACDHIRSCNTIFYGVGVYTIMELFFMAGLSPFLTVYEVFSNPSRAARFLVALYSYIDHSEKDLWRLLRPCIHDGVLAPTTDQRLRYADWLYVWAKERTSMPHRMASLVDEYNMRLNELEGVQGMWGRDSAKDLCDVFEPTFLSAGLQAEINLGHLVFGEDVWLSLGGVCPEQDDPITALYRKYDLLGSSTRLKSGGFYSPLILPHSEFRGKQASHRPTFTFHDPKEMWAITRNFPDNCHWSSEPNMTPKAVREISGPQRDALLIKNIITKSLGVSIGPLEYCGVGHIVVIRAVPYVAVCKGDPQIPVLHEKRILAGLDRVSSHLEASGKHKRGRTEKENQRLSKKLSLIDAGYQRASKLIDAADSESETEDPKPKRRRMNADMRLALGVLM
ncbi:hypothetical protein B0H11DRAFT_2069106 [Mycena galericulata]|nr:hypothetical protein B0H11DRAFT_2069106 [Mycena galericulata]